MTPEAWDFIMKHRLSPEQERQAAEAGAQKAEEIKRKARTSPLMKALDRLEEALRRNV